MRSCDTISDRFFGSSRRDWLNVPYLSQSWAKAINLIQLLGANAAAAEMGGLGAVVDYNQIRDRFFEFEVLCREYADANPATAEWFESMAEMFRKDGERTYRDAHIIAESRALLARSHEALTAAAAFLRLEAGTTRYPTL